MQSFRYYNPTEIIFGKDTHKEVGAYIKPLGSKVLLHYGGGSIKRSGLYDDIVKSLKDSGVDYVELGGVKPNPRLSLVREGIELCRNEGVDFILAVGGGSAIDSAKAIGVGAKWEGDVWELYNGGRQKYADASSIPIATVLTIPAAGSETSPSSVITDEETSMKLAYDSRYSRPVFSIMNPELCFTLSEYQMACGVADIFAHMMERYFTNTTDCDYTDRAIEAGMRSLINQAPKLLGNMMDYDRWCNVMWNGTMAHCGILGMGRQEDWASHAIEHQLSAVYDIPHGAGLAIVFPAWIKYVYQENTARFQQFAARVFDIDEAFEDTDATVFAAIAKLEEFFTKLGLPVRLSQAGIGEENLAEMAKRVCVFGPVGNFKKLATQDVLNIYNMAL